MGTTLSGPTTILRRARRSRFGLKIDIRRNRHQSLVPEKMGSKAFGVIVTEVFVEDSPISSAAQLSTLALRSPCDSFHEAGVIGQRPDLVLVEEGQR